MTSTDNKMINKKEEIIFHHEFNWYCTDDGTFCLLKGDELGIGFCGVHIVGPYRSRLLALSSFRKKIRKESWMNALCTFIMCVILIGGTLLVTNFLI